MRAIAPLVANPWCLVLLLVLGLLIVGAALMVARADRERATTIGYPRCTFPTQSLAASAPLEALAAIHARLLELQHHLPAGSDDSRWLQWFVRRLRTTMDEAYARLDAAPAPLQSRLLDRLAVEVEALAGVVNLQLGATLSRGTDRQALEAQLAAMHTALQL